MQFPTLAMITFAAAFASNVFAGTISASAQQLAVAREAPAITAEAINSARLDPDTADETPAKAAEQIAERPPGQRE